MTKGSDNVETITAYKGFTASMQCHGGYQFELGKTYTHDGEVKACASGFHACEHPLDVLGYYSPSGSLYAVVEQSGDLSRHEDDTKIASRSITIKASIDLPGLIAAAVEHTFSRAKTTKKDTNEDERGAATNCGTSGAASATGYGGAASATGDSGAASATGTSGAASATGTRGAASATGTRGAASATGTSGAASATGYGGAASATGYSGAASATGYSGAASATGDSGAASATGDRGAASATGDRGAAMASGYEGRVMGAKGCALFLVQRDINGKILHAWAGIVGRDGIEPDTWYTLKGGKPVVES